MKDDLHELIDGGLPDEQAAELLHLLSVDPEKRTMFRHQMQLQHGLCRNERHGAMTSLEEGEMLDRISRSIGEPAPSAGRGAPSHYHREINACEAPAALTTPLRAPRAVRRRPSPASRCG